MIERLPLLITSFVFEWLPNTLGFTSNGFTLSGVPNTTGDLKLPYKISYFSGSERKKLK